MLLRDSQGEVSVGIGDYWRAVTGTHGTAVLSVVCPVNIHQPGSPIWCRIVEGSLEFQGETFGQRALLRCRPETVAAGVREYRLAQARGVLVCDESE